MRRVIRNFSLKNIFNKRDRLLLVDKKFFFIKNIALEKSLKSKHSIAKFVIFHLENTCPFQLSDVLYGYFLDKLRKTLVLFICYKKKIEAIYPDLSQYSYILPDFLCDLVHGKECSITRVNLSKNDNIYFIGKEKFEFKLTDDIIFDANLHEYAVKHRIHKSKYLSKFLEFGCYVCLTCSVILLCLILTFLRKHAKLNELKSFTKKNQAAVAKIVAKYAFLNEVNQFLQPGDFCLETLDQINQIRPDSILFTDIQTDAKNRFLKINGHSDSVAFIKEYCEAIKQLDTVKTVATSNIHSKNHKAFFHLEVQFE